MRLGDADSTELHGAFQDSAVKRIDLPGSLRTLGQRTFDSCVRLSVVQFGEELESIGDACFHGCGLAQVVFPRSLQIIGERAFGNCRELESIAVPQDSQLGQVGRWAFAGTCVRHLVVSESVVVEEGASTENIEDK